MRLNLAQPYQQMATLHKIKIEKVVAGGLGFARLHDNMIVFCPMTLTNEEVLAEEVKRSGGYIKGQLKEIIRPSTARIEPACKFYGQCGGCRLQHTNYHNQLEIKQTIIAEALQRAKIDKLCEINQIIPSPLQFNYRFRIRLHLDDKGNMGFHQQNSNRLVPVTHCLLATPPINKLMARFNQTDSGKLLSPVVSQIELQCAPDSNKVHVTIFLAANKTIKGEIINQIMVQNNLSSLSVQDNRGRTLEDFSTLVMGQDFQTNNYQYSLFWHNRSFFQVNPGQNQNMIQTVLELAGKVKGLNVLDLFAGMGNFSIPLALSGANVTAVEINRFGVKSARNNIKRLSIERARVIKSDINLFLSGYKRNQKTDIIILDPPRQGLGEEIIHMSKTGAKKIIYISCEPTTLARDIKRLNNQNYGLKKIVPFDMFPQTHHIETVALLEKN